MKTYCKLIFLIFISSNIFSQKENSDTIYILLEKDYTVDSSVLKLFYNRFYPNEISERARKSDYFLFACFSNKDGYHTGLIINQNSILEEKIIHKSELKNVKIRRWQDFRKQLVSYDSKYAFQTYVLIKEDEYNDAKVSSVKSYLASYIGGHYNYHSSLDINKLEVPVDLYTRIIKGTLTETFRYLSPLKMAVISMDSTTNQLQVKAFLYAESKLYVPPKCDLSIVKEKLPIGVTINDLYIGTNEILGEERIKGKKYLLPYKFVKPKGKMNIHQDFYIILNKNTIGKIKFSYEEKLAIGHLLEYKEIKEEKSLSKNK